MHSEDYHIFHFTSFIWICIFEQQSQFPFSNLCQEIWGKFSFGTVALNSNTRRADVPFSCFSNLHEINMREREREREGGREGGGGEGGGSSPERTRKKDQKIFIGRRTLRPPLAFFGAKFSSLSSGKMRETKVLKWAELSKYCFIRAIKGN